MEGISHPIKNSPTKTKKFVFYAFLIPLFFSLFVVFNTETVDAAECWQYTSAETGCNATNNCIWKNDSWGGWCEDLQCWSLWTQSECEVPGAVPNKNCTWQSGGASYGCEEVSCWSFSGTDSNSCLNNAAGLSCEWGNYCYTTDWSISPDCWQYEDQSSCTSAAGCGWGECLDKGCWSYTDEASCTTATDWRGNNCAWEDYGGGSGNCYERRCYQYSNETACNSAAGISCEWKWNSCQEVDCWSWDFTDQATCENNIANLSCTWSGSICMEQSCWNYVDNATCSAQQECVWASWSGSGWCEELQCWNWDSWDGGNESQCVNNTYGLNCTWSGDPPGSSTNGWCYQEFTGTDCLSLTNERDCMDTFYCWWQYTDWNDPSQGGTCQDPGGDTIFDDWNPGCYIFDMNETNCNNILGCTYSGGECIVNSSHPNANEINTNGTSCALINNSQLCNSIPALSTCCTWNATSCVENRMSTACWDDMKKTKPGASYCEDYAAYESQSLCEEIAGDPWYMPCVWDSSTGRCGFKASDVFGNGSQSLVKLDNKKNCKAAGGRWIKEWYCEGNISVPAGRCEYKFDEETNCDKACYACELFTGNDASDGPGKSVNASNAEEACISSKLGYCEFTADTNAPNGIGYCDAKDQFKKGIAGDCGADDCGACTYLGDPTAPANSSIKRPEDYCGDHFDVCKWITDSSSPTGGYCIDRNEKTCQDACDRCYTQSDCANLGRSALNATGSCEWSDTGYCTKAGETAEVCWDALDNDADGLIDCADPECYADSFCGFVSGDCFGWANVTLCEENGCSWMTDPWGSWCDFPGADCWKYDGNVTACLAKNSTCEWTNGTGSGWCEQDWGMGEDCYSKTSEGDCTITSGCSWTNDTWCQGEGASTDWCQTQGGWCDPESFASKNCWQYDINSTACAAATGCTWQTNEWGASCDVDWSVNCWAYEDNQSYCEANGCAWRTDAWNPTGWCDNKFSSCMDYSTQAECNQNSDICSWDDWSNSCEPLCFSLEQQSGCNAVSGCRWTEGWCMEDWSAGGVDCWNATLSNESNACNAQPECKWKNPGWCNPKGFAGGDAAGGKGGGAGTGMDCWKYDGNESACTNSTLIGMTCSWMSEFRSFCEPDWSSDCWQYDWNSTLCEQQSSCYWQNDSFGPGGWCANSFDQCWSNQSYSDGMGNDTQECNANPNCNWTTMGPGGGWCEPSCFSYTDANSCGGSGSCKWISGWCNPPGMYDMFEGMEAGAPVMVAFDECPESGIPAVVDICGAGMKDMGDSYGFGGGVVDFSSTGICNQQKVGMGQFGNGNETTKFYVYLDTDGNTTGGCRLSNDNSSEGYEFMFKYIAQWNSSTSKAVETFNAYKCGSSGWTAADITLSAWKEKMCSEIQGMMIALQKSDLEKFPTLYNSEKDMRIYVATANETYNAINPSDTAGPGWVTPGAIDFEINDAFSYGADMAKFEDILKKGYVQYEDCFNSVDDDNDGNIDCSDWDCQYEDYCVDNQLGVNAPNFTDTRSPQVVGVKIEEYPDAALIMYDTNKPANGTLEFYYNDSTCGTLNTSVYDVGILSNDVREYKLWHYGELYDDGDPTSNVSLDYSLTNGTAYYYKLKVCDSAGKCAISKCSNFTTPATTSQCGYCNFVTRIKEPTGWNVYYDLNQNGTYDHWQGNECGPDAGMKTNYTNGRSANIKLTTLDANAGIEFFNVTLTKSGLNDKVRTISTSGSLLNGTTTDSAGTAIGYVGMISETRDKIVNNLHPEVCQITIPRGGTNCEELWHCDDNFQNCVNVTANSTLVANTSTTCTWKKQYCEFSGDFGGLPGTPSEAVDDVTPVSGGGGGTSSQLPFLVQSFTEFRTSIMNNVIIDRGLTTKQFYDAPLTIAAPLLMFGDYPVPSDISGITLTKPIESIDDDVYEYTATKVLAKFFFPNTIIIARGDLSVDGMAATAYAKVNNLPILLTEPGELPSVTLNTVQKLNPSKIIIAGGSVAVSEEVESKLKDIGIVERKWGATRYETAVELAKTIRNPSLIVITEGYNPTIDAVIMSAVYKAPLIYVGSEDIPQSVKDYLVDNKDVNVLTVGVSDSIASEIESLMQ